MNEPRKSNYLLHIENVYKQYGDHVVLDDIDFSIAAGELCTLVGPSGCGKSTLLRLILGQEEPSAGHLYIDGQELGFPSPERGIVYQRYSLYPHLTVLANVLLGQTLQSNWFGTKKIANHGREQAMDYLRKVRLEQHFDKYPHELSGGMLQRAAIAQALVMRPRILLMDEPFGALDPQTREDMQLFLLEIWEHERMTVFFVTHDLQEALYLGSRLIVLSQYYTDDRGAGKQVRRGAKLVADYPLASVASSSAVKNKREFVDLMQEIRKLGFDPQYLQHVTDFNLVHPDSFQTLSSDLNKD